MTIQRTLDPHAVALPDLECGGCTTCCQGDSIRLVPGDDPTQYETTRRADGHDYLTKGEGGDCVYLGPSGCRIHGRSPTACRIFDCRRYAIYRQDIDHLHEGRRRTILVGRERLRDLGLWDD